MVQSEKKIGIVKYGAGNLFSLCATLDRINIPYGFVNQEEDLEAFSHFIIPGVGHAARAYEKLQASGLTASIKKLSKPVLGICVGMQLLTAHSAEGEVDLLNIFPLQTKKFQSDWQIKIPHMGWNRVFFKDKPLFKGLSSGSYFYFVHSYFIEYNPKFDIGYCQYGTSFSAAIADHNFHGVQFHPEKSGAAGEQLLKNFFNLN